MTILLMDQSISIDTLLYHHSTILRNSRLVCSSMEYVTFQRGEEGTECSIAKYGATLTSWKVVILILLMDTLDFFILK